MGDIEHVLKLIELLVKGKLFLKKKHSITTLIQFPAHLPPIETSLRFQNNPDTNLRLQETPLPWPCCSNVR